MPSKDKPDASLREALAALQRLADAFAQRRAQLAQSAGLSEAQWRVLEQIAAEDFMPSLFARRRARSAAAVSKVIRQLLDQKLIAVEIAEGDARQRRYSLSGWSCTRAMRKSAEPGNDESQKRERPAGAGQSSKRRAHYNESGLPSQR